MSAFERKRLENIAANREILKDISTTAAKIIPEKKPILKSSAPRRRPRTEPVKREATKPTRMSSRLAGMEADSEDLKRRMAVDIENEIANYKAKKRRVNEDLTLGDVVVEGKKWGNSVDGLKGIIRGAEPGIRTFTEDDVKETTDKSLKDLRLRMGALNLYEHWLPNGKHPLGALGPCHCVLKAVLRDQNHTTTNIRPWLSSHRGKAHCLCW